MEKENKNDFRKHSLCMLCRIHPRPTMSDEVFCEELDKKHTSNWQHGKPQKAYYDLEGLKIFYEDGKIWHYRPIDENTIEWC